jgi:hypothetical protein
MSRYPTEAIGHIPPLKRIDLNPRRSAGVAAPESMLGELYRHNRMLEAERIWDHVRKIAEGG